MMNVHLNWEPNWFLTEETLLHCYIVTLLHCTNIFSIKSVILTLWPCFLPDYKQIIYKKLPFKGFKLVTTHELLTASCAGVL
jgi:hypothetical protein